MRLMPDQYILIVNLHHFQIKISLILHGGEDSLLNLSQK